MGEPIEGLLRVGDDRLEEVPDLVGVERGDKGRGEMVRACVFDGPAQGVLLGHRFGGVGIAIVGIADSVSIEGNLEAVADEGALVITRARLDEGGELLGGLQRYVIALDRRVGKEVLAEVPDAAAVDRSCENGEREGDDPEEVLALARRRLGLCFDECVFCHACRTVSIAMSRLRRVSANYTILWLHRRGITWNLDQS